MKLRVEVPATIANLGPGFDAFGLAIDLCNVVEIDTDRPAGVRWSGEGADELPTDGNDLVSRAIHETAGGAVPPFAIAGTNAIPLERGLGSSAAAAVAGALIGQALAGRPASAADAFAVAASLEGHPDNAAAAAFGGFTIVVDGAVIRRDPHPGIAPTVLVPREVRTATAAARADLPAALPLADAATNAARAAAVALALTGDPSLLAGSLVGPFHEDVRLAAVPEVRAVAEELRAAGVPLCVSGSGPTLVAFPAAGDRIALDQDRWHVLRPPVRRDGARLTVLDA